MDNFYLGYNKSQKTESHNSRVMDLWEKHQRKGKKENPPRRAHRTLQRASKKLRARFGDIDHDLDIEIKILLTSKVYVLVCYLSIAERK